MDFWIALFTGGVGGSVCTLLTQIVSNGIKAPKLSLLFDESTEGCSIPKVTYWHRNGDAGERKYLRVMVRNKGRTEAKDVQIIVTKIESNVIPKWSFSGEVFNLVWSSSDSSSRSDIPSLTHRFADVCYADYDPDLRHLTLCATGGNLERLSNADATGRITLEISVAASNARTKKSKVAFEFDGTAAGLKILKR